VVNEQEYHENAKNSWQHSTTREFSQKTKFLAPDLRKLRKKPRNSDLLAQIENQILDQQSLHPSQQNHALQKQLLEKHQNLMAKEGTYHIQRVKKRWAVVGDKTTSFFHHSIVKRNRKNHITHLTNPDGTQSTTPDQLAATLTNYFTDIFSTQNTIHQSANAHPHSYTPTTTSFDPTDHDHNNNDGMQGCSNNMCADEQRIAMHEEEAIHNNERFRYTYSIPDFKGIHDIIRKMRSNVAPGPDGFNAAFYNSAWQWAKDDIYKVVKDFYTYAQMPPDINQTFISLIPKKSNLDVPQDYRPISLCDVIYKIIAKSLANRIKDRLPNYVV
jgi:hypothetical protein